MRQAGPKPSPSTPRLHPAPRAQGFSCAGAGRFYAGGCMVHIGNSEPFRIPSESVRGDGIGCRRHTNCRHTGLTLKGADPSTGNWRFEKVREQRRQARRHHPRNN